MYGFVSGPTASGRAKRVCGQFLELLFIAGRHASPLLCRRSERQLVPIWASMAEPLSYLVWVDAFTRPACPQLAELAQFGANPNSYRFTCPI